MKIEIKLRIRIFIIITTIIIPALSYYNYLNTLIKRLKLDIPICEIIIIIYTLT